MQSQSKTVYQTFILRFGYCTKFDQRIDQKLFIQIITCLEKYSKQYIFLLIHECINGIDL